MNQSDTHTYTIWNTAGQWKRFTAVSLEQALAKGTKFFGVDELVKVLRDDQKDPIELQRHTYQR